MLTPAIFRPLYLAMVRPHLDYAVQALFPYLQKDIKWIERTQRLATKCVKSFRKVLLYFRPEPEVDCLQSAEVPTVSSFKDRFSDII